ncbi:hypothetical protein QZH41_009718 [Actinostola sp. cb2023]|nr:hypothetical protein QZH41_009718 [Actinostola sp. cb2023]
MIFLVPSMIVLGYTKIQAGLLSTVFEVGGVVGSVLLGVVIDRFFHGRTVHGVCLTVLCSAISLALFYFTSDKGIIINCLFMFIAGACNCGPDPYISGSIAASIGERENAQAAVSGLINGFGSIGTVIEGPVIGWMVQHYGWAGPFYIMIGLSVFGTLCMVKAVRVDESIKKSQFMSQVASET